MTIDPKHKEALDAMEAELRCAASMMLDPSVSVIATARAAAERALTPKRWRVVDAVNETVVTDEKINGAIFRHLMPGGAPAAREAAERLCAEWNAREGVS